MTEVTELIQKYTGPRIARRILEKKKKLERLALLLSQDLLENKVIDLHVASLNFFFHTGV